MISKSKRNGITGRPKADRSGYVAVPASVESRKALASRAKARRRQLERSAAEVATAVEVSGATLAKWEALLPTYLVPEQVRRWEQALDAPSGWLTDEGISAPDVDAESLRTTLAQRARQRRMAKGLTQKYLKDRLGVELATFKRWERALPRRLQPDQQQQWEAALQVPHGWLYSLSMTDGEPTPRNDQKAAPPAGVYRSFGQSAEIRSALSFRAAERRTIIGLTVRELGALVGIRPHTMTTFEQEMPDQLLEEQVAKWEDALEAPRGWLSDLAVQAAPPGALQADWPGFDTVLEAIRAVASWLVRARLHDRSFHYSDLDDDEKRRVNILLCRYGIPSSRPGVDVTAAKLGTSRHEVNQVVTTMAGRAVLLDGKRLPPLDEVPHLVEALTPSTISVLDAKLSGILGGVSIENADLFCRSLLGRSFFRDMDRPAKFSGAGHAVIGNEAESVAIAMSARLMRDIGAVQIHTLYGLVANAYEAPISAKELAVLTTALPGFEQLDEATGWFWVAPRESSLVPTVALKILAACGASIEAKEITQGIAQGVWKQRDSLAVFHAFTPPEAVVVAILSRLPDFRVDQKYLVETTRPVSPSDCLSGAELAVLQCVQAHGGIVSWAQMKADLVDQPVISLPALNQVLRNSPIVRKIDRALYAIRGIGFSGSALDKALSRPSRNGEPPSERN